MEHPNEWSKEELQYNHAEIVRRLWQHENEMVNVRFTWFLTAQGLLFAGIGIAWEKNFPPLFIGILCVLGIMTTLSTMAAFKLSWIAKVKLDIWWRANLNDYSGPPITGDGINGITWERELVEKWSIWFRPWAMVPAIFLLAWLTLIGFFYIK